MALLRRGVCRNIHPATLGVHCAGFERENGGTLAAAKKC